MDEEEFHRTFQEIDAIRSFCAGQRIDTHIFEAMYRTRVVVRINCSRPAFRFAGTTTREEALSAMVVLAMIQNLPFARSRLMSERDDR